MHLFCSDGTEPNVWIKYLEIGEKCHILKSETLSHFSLMTQHIT